MIRTVLSRTVNEKWVKEHRISGLHDKMNSRSVGIIVANAVVHFVHSALRDTT